MKRLHLILLMSLMSFITMAQTKPTESQAYKKIKEYKYPEFIAKDAGIPLSQVKIEKRMVDDGSTNMSIGKTTVAEENYWPMDEIVFFYVCKTPKDKDGIERTYDFTVKYRRSQCNSGVCVLLDSWQFVSATKYGPRIEGAKAVSAELITGAVTELLRNDKEGAMDELYVYGFEKWIEITGVSYPEEGSWYAKQKDISATQKECYAYIDGYAVSEVRNDPTKLEKVYKKRALIRVFMKRDGQEWSLDYIKTFGSSSVEILEERDADADEYYYTFEEVSFDEIYQKRMEKAKPLESCTKFILACNNFVENLEDWQANADQVKGLYQNVADAEKDLAVLNYLTESGFEVTIAMGEHKCEQITHGYYGRMIITLKHSKIKGKLYKELKAYEMVGNSIYYLQKDGELEFSIVFEPKIVEDKWELSKGWSHLIFKNFQ